MKDLPFKAVAIDVDGTFVNDEKKYDHEMFGEILYRLHKHGAHFIIASGRPARRLEADFGDFLLIQLISLLIMVQFWFVMAKSFVQQLFLKNVF